MAYKFQKGTANLSGSIKLDSGYDLLGAGSNDLGTSAANFAVGYISVLSASTVVSGAFFEGDASRLTNVAATDITTTGTSADADYYPLFVDTAAGESGETIRVHSTVAINPSKGKISATMVSASTGTGSFGGGIEAANELFLVDYTGSVDCRALELNAGGITNAGSIAGATTISGSGALSVGAGATLAGALNLQAGGITNAGSIAGATTIDASGDLTVGSITMSEFTVDSSGNTDLDGTLNAEGAATFQSTISGSGALSVGAGATLAGALNMQSGGITNAGSIAGATTIVASSTISGSGALSVGAGATLAGALNMQNGGITNVGDLYGTLSVQGVTGSGLILDASMCASAASYLSLKENLTEAFYVAQGEDTYLTFITTNDDESVKSSMDFIIGDNVNSGKFLSLNGGIDFSGQKTLTASVNLDEDGESGIYHYQSHYIVSGSSAVVVDLPSLDNGYSMWFKRHPSMTNNVTIRPSGSTNLIDGINDPVVLETAGASMQLVGSGSLNWYIY